MFNKQLKTNIKQLDLQIGKLSEELAVEIEDSNEYELKMEKLKELTKIRSQLSENKVSESNAPTIISGALGVSAILIVLNYERTDIVTSKAFGMATNLFRGV